MFEQHDMDQAHDAGTLHMTRSPISRSGIVAERTTQATGSARANSQKSRPGAAL
jgi:hypothetical protein